MFNVAKVKYCLLGNDGHSVRFLNRFRKFIYLSSTVSEMFFITWCSVDKFSPHIFAYHLGPYRFSTNENFVIEVRIKVEFSELSLKTFRKMKQFWKLLSMENSVLLKGPKKPDTKSSKIAGLSRMFFA